MIYLPAQGMPMNPPVGFAALPVGPPLPERPAAPGRRLSARCYELRIVVPQTYGALENAVERWISTCVMSRTPVAGRPIHRERGLVHGNPTLRQVWNEIAHAAGKTVPIRATYVWSTERVESIRFSTPIRAPRLPPGPACRFRIADALRIETEAARRTLLTSARVAASFERSVGALDARGRFTKTIIDNKYWFAKLYERITHFEIRDRNKFKHPAFVMHFIPIFYDMYHTALRDWQDGRRSRVHALWQRHFTTAARPARNGLQSWINGVANSIVTGVAAHIRGDMAEALDRAYRSYTSKYCLDRLRLDDLHADFFATSRRIFEIVAAEFFLDLARYSPLPLSPEMGQFVIGTGARYGAGGLDIDQVYGWRAAAWAEAKQRLGQ